MTGTTSSWTFLNGLHVGYAGERIADTWRNSPRSERAGQRTSREPGGSASRVTRPRWNGNGPLPPLCPGNRYYEHGKGERLDWAMFNV